MAIQFARIEIVSRSGGGNACCKGAYNGRSKVKDEKTNVIYNFSNRGDNVYHAILLPEHVDSRFSILGEFLNEVERCEKRKDSQLLKDVVLALPDDKELSLEDGINITHLLIEKRGWVRAGLGVQVDIHQPHDGEKNWHAHLLVTTRRFKEDGLTFGGKATDLNPEFKKYNKKAYVVPEAEQIHEELRDIINDYFKKLGLENRVDVIGINPQEHIGPVRMRSILNAAVERNEERRMAEVEQLGNGVAVVDKVTRHMSVFSRGDLVRAVKCVDDFDAQERLVEEALGHQSIVTLYKEDGTKAGFFTTREVREEENKIVRLSGYVENVRNVILGGGKIKEIASVLVDEAVGDLTSEQHKALGELIFGESGLRIVRGRAGVGKSYLLGKINMVASSAGINVIGVAPTHKARVELERVGYERNDTVKGMLFKLANGRVSLAKGSLIVVDEAGMIGNDDYQELLRVAATRKCNVILAGDERQLSSVGRGGMFEVLAQKYGSSSVFAIKRQSSNWGREVASCFAGGRVLEGLLILEGNDRIRWSSNAEGSMAELLSDWGSSKYAIGDRIILAVENKHVDALNAGARQYLKFEGRLQGEEISVSGNYYMKGDRIVITRTNKELGVIHGELGEVLDASTERFIISIAGREGVIAFNPQDYDGFRHGYATTVFKAQGSSIKDVYVLHDRFCGIRNSYVSLSRHIEELKLYSNRESSPDMKVLVKQLGRDFNDGSSLQYLTAEEINDRDNIEGAKQRLTGRLLVGALNILERVTDKYIPRSEYYNYREPAKAAAIVEKVSDNFVWQEAAGFAIENKIAVGEDKVSGIGGVSGTNKARMSAKERFYANADYVRAEKRRYDIRLEWDQAAEELKGRLRYKAEVVARDLLGEPNKRLSNGRELRFGEHGKIVLRISGEKAGMWYDFSEGKGGDLFDLAEQVRGFDFKTAAEYLRRIVGMESASKLDLVREHSSSNEYVDRYKAKKLEEQREKEKVKVTADLLARAKEVGKGSVAYRYFRDERNISCELSQDIKTTSIYEKSIGRSLPAVIAFARDESGNITGRQKILLDSKSAKKAKVEVAKKSFGHIGGSFVEVGNTGGDLAALSEREAKSHETITIIAEGLETALSVKQALSEHSDKQQEMKLLCSLGISNIRNYRAREGEKIIIAADNDGPDSVTEKVVDHAKSALAARGAFVEVVKPDRQGDFNDMLKAGEGKRIYSLFSPLIAGYKARTLEEYVAARHEKNPVTIDDNDREHLAYITKMGVGQEQIVNAWRKNGLCGKIELDELSKRLRLLESNLAVNHGILELAGQYKINIDKRSLVEDLLNNISLSAEEVCIRYILGQFGKEKQSADKIGKIYNIINSEDGFLSGLKVENKGQLSSDLQERMGLSASGESTGLLARIKDNLAANYKQGIVPYDALKSEIVSFGIDIKGLNTSLNKLVIQGREKYLGAISIELKELDKLGCNYDKDEMVGKLKSMSYKERKEYGDKILGEEAKKHIEPIFNQYTEERMNAGSFEQFLNIVEKEQEAHINLRNNHRFALRALDKLNGNLKFTMITNDASSINSNYATVKAIKLLGYAAKNNIISQEKIMNEINGQGGTIRSIYSEVKFRCEARYDKSQEQQREVERQKQPEIKLDKGMSE